jgi:hypothetical protein
VYFYLMMMMVGQILGENEWGCKKGKILPWDQCDDDDDDDDERMMMRKGVQWCVEGSLYSKMITRGWYKKTRDVNATSH